MEQVLAGPPGSQDHVQTSVQLSPESKTSHVSPDDSQQQATARKYNKTKIILGLVGTVLFFALTFIFVASGLSHWLDKEVHEFVSNDYVALLLFVAVVGIAETLLSSPLSFYSGYYLEHKYHLSNQSFLTWVWENLKGMMVSVPLGVPILLLFYYCLKSFGDMWWLPVATILFFFTVVLARLGPILIFPLFYKFVPVEDGAMKEAILALCSRVGVKVEGIFTFNLSKNTKKANAAFTGIGKSKRIILGDTLIQNFTNDEIEGVFAHELGHLTKKHIWLMMAIGTFSSFLGLFLTARLYEISLPWMGFTSPDQLGALPLLTLWLGLYSLVTSPMTNGISRQHEYAADRYAVETTGRKEPFVNALKKLARINLADTNPPPVVEFLFHSHPSIEKRIRAIESIKT